MSNAWSNPSRRGGFTLVELITVIAVLGILVILMVGAVKGVQNYVAGKATTEVFEAIEAGLQQYYSDWGKYPWWEVCDADSDFAKPAIEYVTTTLTMGDDAEATLYSALNARVRHGPYFRGSATAAQKRVASGKVYFVFVDGWGRKITYAKPASVGKPPILTSTGADEFDDTDDIKNYTDP